MWVISLVQWLQMAATGAAQVAQAIEDIKAARGKVTVDGTPDGEAVTPERLQASYDELMANAGAVGDAFIADLARRHAAG